MRNAVEFARLILRKQEAIKRTTSPFLQRDYKKSIDNDIRELKFYCGERGFNYGDIMRLARNDDLARDRREP